MRHRYACRPEVEAEWLRHAAAAIGHGDQVPADSGILQALPPGGSPSEPTRIHGPKEVSGKSPEEASVGLRTAKPPTVPRLPPKPVTAPAAPLPGRDRPGKAHSGRSAQNGPPKDSKRASAPEGKPGGTVFDLACDAAGVSSHAVLRPRAGYFLLHSAAHILFWWAWHRSWLVKQRLGRVQLVPTPQPARYATTGQRASRLH